MKTVSLFLATMLLMPVVAQKVIKVRNQHSRVLINTLKQNEQIVRGETRILVKTDGENYEYLTRLDASYRHYNNAQLVEVLPYAMFNHPAFYQYIEKVGGAYMDFAKIGGKRIGPYTELNLYYSDNSQLSGLYGYTYHTDKGYFLVDKIGGKNYGPFDELGWTNVQKETLLMLYRKGEKWYVADRKNTYGPYEAVAGCYVAQKTEIPVFLYSEKGEWHVHFKTPINLTFTEKPEVRIADDGTWEICGIQTRSDGKQRIFLQNGTSYLHTAESQTIYIPGLPVLTAVRTGATIKPSLSGRFEYDQSYTIKRGDEVLGEFYIEQLYGQLIGKSDNIYPFAFYRKQAGSIAESKKNFCLLRADQGFTDPIPATCRYTITLGGDYYAYLDNKEGRFYLNGQKQDKEGVELVDFSTYPEAWYMAAKEGYYTAFYKNGKADQSGALERKFPYRVFPTRKLPHIIVTEDGKSYAKTPQSSKLYGPVNARSVIAFSQNNAHYAEGDERSAQILIDGKVIGSGYGLVFNEHKNAFHWVEQEGQKLYLHTYELD